MPSICTSQAFVHLRLVFLLHSSAERCCNSTILQVLTPSPGCSPRTRQLWCETREKEVSPWAWVDLLAPTWADLCALHGQSSGSLHGQTSGPLFSSCPGHFLHQFQEARPWQAAAPCGSRPQPCLPAGGEIKIGVSEQQMIKC